MARIITLDTADKFEAFRQLAFESSSFGSLDRELFYEAVCARERIQNTGVGHAVALAHGKFDGVKKVDVALGISYEGIRYGAVDGVDVHLLFLFASSAALQPEYLSLLQRVLVSARKPDARALLENNPSGEEIDRIVSRDFSWLEQL